MNKKEERKYYDHLIFESGYTGHRVEYVKHVMNYINQNENLHGKYSFLLNEKIHPLLSGLNASQAYKIYYLQFNEKHSNSVSKGFSDWQLIDGFLKSTDPFSEITFLDIDPYLVLLTTRRFLKYRMKVNGILFQPYIHFSKIPAMEKLKPVLKNFLFQKIATLLNSNIKRLYILNDKKGVKRLNRNIKNVFYYLPDPIDDEIIHITSPAAIVEKFGISDNKRNLLLFGRIDHRKNLLNIIDSLRLLPAPERNKIRLIVAGAWDENVKAEYLDYIGKYRNEIEIVYNDAYVNDEERELLFQQSDIILMPYINFYSSSGVLGHTIKSGKNVIVSAKGIVADIVKENYLGKTVDPMKPAEIRDAISELLQRPKSKFQNNKEMIREYSPGNFSKVLLGDFS